jgi:23S rRNA (cytidine1920-2'-O)/16S rRNA (cytidine1409-2'-O)-methyltransferase
MKRQRIDTILVEKGLAETIEKARAFVMAGAVLVNEQRAGKSADLVSPEDVIRVKGRETKYVGRGGLKLEKALESFEIDVNECFCLDVGSSTGGFTDCLLQKGAKKVVAIDSGRNQMVWELRQDPRVDLRETTNARFLKPEDFECLFDLAVMDVSFISATKLFPSIVPLLRENANFVVLIKPQFEVRKSEVGEGGIVTDIGLHERVVNEVNESAEMNGLEIIGVIDSPILGMEGNKEFLACYTKK